MSQISVTKSFSWDMSHMLAGHQGQCKNLHGHTYKLEVEVVNKVGQVQEVGPGRGMVVDFKDLKDLVKDKIVDPFDHSFLYWSNSTADVEHQVADILKENDRKLVEVDFRPTAENMAVYFWDLLKPELLELGLDLNSIRVWETETSYAEVKGD
jgi:6-pyruvoyltetrahydropterin/6-carboxytetrahydropterin synthase